MHGSLRVKYEKHPSILVIRTKYNRNGDFSFRDVSLKEIETEIRLLKLIKASQYSDIPTKIVKENSDIFSNFTCESINNSLKHADVTPLHKKCNKSLKENYIAKLNAYGFSLQALRLIHDYLSNRKQRTRINNSYSAWMEIVFGVPQGSILAPLLFTDIANYADDNTPYATAII